jgi:hypothetical protein
VWFRTSKNCSTCYKITTSPLLFMDMWYCILCRTNLRKIHKGVVSVVRFMNNWCWQSHTILWDVLGLWSTPWFVCIALLTFVSVLLQRIFQSKSEMRFRMGIISYRVGHEKVARVKANNMRSRTASVRGGGEEMLTARLLTNCSITQRSILTPERISQVPEREYHKDRCTREAG